MALFETLAGLLARDAPKYVYARIPTDRANDASFDAAPLQAGRHYFRVWLSEMCLRRDREWFKTWHPAVHSMVRFQFGTQRIDVPYVAGALQLQGVDAAHLDQVVQLNHPLTSLMPFNGGVVELMAGLVAMQGDDYVASFLKVMGDFAGLLAVPQLSAALQVAGPLASGLQVLLGASNGMLHLGLHQAFIAAGGGGANELRPGYLLVALAAEDQLTLDRLWVADDRLRYGSSVADSMPLTGHTYMLLRIESRVERDDWDALETIQTPFQGALEALGGGELERAESMFRRAIATALQSPDLTRADRRRVAQALKEEYDEARGAGLAASRGQTATLNQAMQRAPSVDEAAARGELTFEELFAT